MKHSERFALDSWLCDYPTDHDYEEIIRAMYAAPNNWDHPELELWEVVENFTLGQVADMIEMTRQHFERTLKTIFKEKAEQ